MLKAVIILSLGISPSLIYWALRQRMENRAVRQLRTTATRLPITTWSPPNLPPETQYIEGVGYIIGDITCEYNARSPQIRCAVNPAGPCQDCRFYEPREIKGS